MGIYNIIKDYSNSSGKMEIYKKTGKKDAGNLNGSKDNDSNSIFIQVTRFSSIKLL